MDIYLCFSAPLVINKQGLSHLKSVLKHQINIKKQQNDTQILRKINEDS